jgi:hypothetical protein
MLDEERTHGDPTIGNRRMADCRQGAGALTEAMSERMMKDLADLQ